MGVTRTNGIPRPARQQQLQGAGGRRQEARLQGSATPATWRSTPSRATAAAPASRSASASRAASRARNGRRSTRRSRRARRPASSRCGRNRMVLQDRARRHRQGDGRASMPTRTASMQRAEGARRRGRRQLDREPAAAAQLGVDHVPRRPRQLLRAGRQQLHAAHDRLGLRDLREAGAHVSRHHHGRHHPRRGAARSVARLRRRLRDGDAVARPAVHGGVPRSRRLGPRLHLGDRPLREHGRHVDRRRGHAAGDEPRHAASKTEKDQFGMPIPNVHFDDHPNDIAMRNHAYKQGTAVYEAVGATRDLPDAALSVDAQSRHQPDEREARGTASSTSSARPTTSRTCSSPTAASSPPAAPRIRR